VLKDDCNAFSSWNKYIDNSFVYRFPLLINSSIIVDHQDVRLGLRFVHVDCDVEFIVVRQFTSLSVMVRTLTNKYLCLLVE
jgi:hypothetical protein